MDALKEKQGSAKCMSSRADHVEDQALWYRVYMRWCPHETLQYLISSDDLHRKGSPRVPEAALLSFFNDMIEACLVLEFGDATAVAKLTGWKSFVHRNIKPNNIFLDSPEESPRFPEYPKAVLGDFGIAVMTDKMDPNNLKCNRYPLRHCLKSTICYNDNAGTPGWKAPEMIRQIHKTSLSRLDLPRINRPEMKLGGACNVWGVSAIMTRLMNQDTANWKKEHALHDHYASAEASRPVQLDEKTEGFYSRQLRELVNSCTAYLPHDRPTLVELRREIQKCTQPGSVHDRANGMRTHVGNLAQWDLLQYYKDEYKLNMAYSRG
ncbi:uncharacterized protein LTR77_004073 [Saxophila tyrrhenica]|uniref:non-specific serine/threonine protein kinase n=1 Tax=Saxophila tyrrhenica TaxID=1690608 RepID=A0AAV9PBL2_9PEZI|nr:hypothetical protein LTR77_004073 [Saxophila tyrrhenica]